jgi:hypothetical protein
MRWPQIWSCSMAAARKVHMATVCTTREGKVATLVDYYDFASGLVSPSRRVARAYRSVIVGLFM